MRKSNFIPQRARGKSPKLVEKRKKERAEQKRNKIYIRKITEEINETNSWYSENIKLKKLQLDLEKKLKLK